MDKLLIRVDGSAEIGLGHIVRCTSLAQMAKDIFSVTFVCKEIPLESGIELKEKGFKLLMIDNEETFIQRLSTSDTVILDGYHFNTDYERLIKNKCRKLLTIDDLFNRHFVADVVINHGLGINLADYSKERYTKVYIGTDYLLMRSNFYEATTKERSIESVKNLYVNMGGSDPSNIAGQILEYIDSRKFNSIHIVLGAANSKLNEITNLIRIKKFENVFLHYNLDQFEMQRVMESCEFAICTPSGVAYELCCIGIGMIVCKTDDNQKYFFRELVGLGLALGVDIAQEKYIEVLLQKCYECITSPKLIGNQMAVQRKYFTANSRKNVREVLCN